MSHTDKTQPYWVKIKQIPQDRVENHDHRNGICDLDPNDNESYGWTKPHRCHYGFTHAANRRVYARPSRIEQMYRKEENGKVRTKLRTDLRKALKLNGDVDIQNYQHRHSALWDAW